MHFTKHALEKFNILRRHGFLIRKKDIIEAVNNPGLIDYSRLSLKIAQRALTKNMFSG